MDIEIVVKKEALIEAAENVQGIVGALNKIFDSLDKKVDGTSSYWEGEGNSLFIQNYRAKKEMADTALRRFMENATDLRAIAMGYEQSERKNERLASSLPGDVIS